MNLIEDAWIPVRRANGKIFRIAPWQITDKYQEDPIESLAAPRPDFNGALIQFLIGLIQTCAAPNNSQQWRQGLREPPAPEDLRQAFSSIIDAFHLDGDGPRFLQDFTLESEIMQMDLAQRSKRIKPIGELLIEVPSGKTLEDNTDHFVKRGGVEKLCLACAATALFTMQTNAPAGGSGNLTGLRGGGPLTTVVISDTLWKTCWLNILDRDDFLVLTGNRSKNDKADRFPWVAPTRTSESGRVTTPEDVHPDQVFWSMPRRIRLLFSDISRGTVCDLCGEGTYRVASQFLAKKLGVKYSGPWKHPLSPYFVDNSGSPSPIHLQPGGIGYRHWLGLLQNSDNKKGKREPARVVENYVLRGQEDLRIWAFGYDMDNMKARCWYDCTMPLLLCDQQIRSTFEWCIAALVRSAETVSSELSKHVKKALFKPEVEIKGDLSFITTRLWQETEPLFLRTVLQIRKALVEASNITPFMASWHKILIKVAEEIFDGVSQTGAFEAADPKRIALARKDLQKTLYGKKLCQQLGLPN